MSVIDRRGATVGAADPPIATNPNPDLAIKAPVRVATTGSNIVLSGLLTIDGVALAAGDRVLVKDQTDATTNGLYNAATSGWTRTIDANNNSQWTQGTEVAVTQGSVNKSTLWGLTSPAPPITLGTSTLTFTQLTIFGAATPTTITNRQIYAYTPVYDLGTNNQSTPLLFTTSGITVPANDTYQAIGIFQSNRNRNTATISASAQFDGIVIDLESLSGSDSTSNMYAAVCHVTNDGPGTTKAVHGAAFGSGTSSGTIMCYNGQIQPVITNSNAVAFFSSLTSSSVNGIAVGFDLESNGDQYLIGFGSYVNPVPITTACFRAWMATASAAGARAYQTLNNAGGEIQYVKLDGTVVSTVALVGGTETNGITITASAITRTNTAGNITIAAGTSSGTITLQGGGNTGMVVNADGSLSILTTAANGSVATVLGSLGPVGSHTTVQGWWKASFGGVTGFVPFF